MCAGTPLSFGVVGWSPLAIVALLFLLLFRSSGLERVKASHTLMGNVLHYSFVFSGILLEQEMFMGSLTLTPRGRGHTENLFVYMRFFVSRGKIPQCERLVAEEWKITPQQ